MNKVHLWDNFHLTEEQLRKIEIVDFQYYSKSEAKYNSEQSDMAGKYLLIVPTIVGVLAGVFYQDGTVGMGVWFATMVAMGPILLVRRKFFAPLAEGETRYKIYVRAFVAGAEEKYISPQQYKNKEDAENAVKEILSQLKSDALRKSHNFL